MLKSQIPPIESSCSAREVFALMALGDSMLPEFRHGTLMVIDPEAPVRDKDFVIAEIDGEHILRQLLIKDEKYYLQALNPGPEDEVVEIKGIEQITGKVIQQGSRKKNLKKYQ